MTEMEFKQQALNKLNAKKELLNVEINKVLRGRDELDTTAKNIAGALQLLDAQIEEAKQDIDGLDKKE